MLDELRQGAHGGALAQWGELVAVFEEDFDLEFGIGGVIFATAGVNASRYVATVSGLTGKSTRKS